MNEAMGAFTMCLFVEVYYKSLGENPIL